MNDKANEDARDDDATLHAVLTAVCNATPEPGMEHRLLQRLEALESSGAATEPATAWWVLWLRWLALPLLAAAAVLAIALHRPPAAPPQQALQTRTLPAVGHRPVAVQRVPAALPGANRDTERQPTSATDEEGAAMQSRPEVFPQRERKTTPASPLQSVAPAHLVVHLPRTVAGLETKSVAHAGSAELSTRLQLSGFPAPPMPLTEQERLLLRVAHRNDPATVALLDPAARAEQTAHERAQVRRFFTPPPLPADLQQEIDRAVQAPYLYAHTQPTPDRNLP